MGLKAVLFDLDGTLVDSVSGLHQAVNAVLIEQGGDGCSVDEVRHWVGNGPKKLIQRALESRGIDMSPEDGLAAFREHYARTLFSAEFYPGVPQGLARLKAAGLRLACITNKSSHFTGPFLTHMGLSDTFDAVLCGDQVEHPKPHPESLIRICEGFEIEPDQALMVGDSVNDLIPARDIGMPALAVSYGYHQNQNLADYDAEAVLDDFSAIVERVLTKSTGSIDGTRLY
ncbi:HAD family hydrolase [Saccharospirillum salsuginis]|uniref:phosphoglycolate phosphatase n=1 Tax=Saccharospirillum salsuginis TaxID=418750 RepID=A0A918N5V4_9GAMM|nr:HAD family hydrolase [Saccharospirillum salsuginis]GGX43448.1 phosphoglycolate phosphatase [Saccharospirillum salsuginis]